MRELTIQIDANEQQPLPFPRTVVWSPEDGTRQVFLLKTERVKLTCGDYRLKQFPRCGGVERKKSIDELAQNFFAREDRVRFHHAWARFVTAYEFPMLLVEQPLQQTATFRYKAKNRQVSPEDVMSEVWRLVGGCSKLAVVWPSAGSTYGARLRLGTEVARFLVTVALDSERR